MQHEVHRHRHDDLYRRAVQQRWRELPLTHRVEGMVTIEATISTDGSVINTRVTRSQPLLDQAALDAVRQWKFTPTLLNGAPVEVIMTVTVNFMLH